MKKDNIYLILLIIFVLVWGLKWVFNIHNLFFISSALLIGCIAFGIGLTVDLCKYIKKSDPTSFFKEVSPFAFTGFLGCLLVLGNLVLYKLGYVSYLIIK